MIGPNFYCKLARKLVTGGRRLEPSFDWVIHQLRKLIWSKFFRENGAKVAVTLIGVKRTWSLGSLPFSGTWLYFR